MRRRVLTVFVVVMLLAAVAGSGAGHAAVRPAPTMTLTAVATPGGASTQAVYVCTVFAQTPYLESDGRVYGDVAVTCNTRVTRINMQLDLTHLGAEHGIRRIEKSFTEAIVGSTSLVCRPGLYQVTAAVIVTWPVNTVPPTSSGIFVSEVANPGCM
jgi:hypothetical protein